MSWYTLTWAALVYGAIVTTIIVTVLVCIVRSAWLESERRRLAEYPEFVDPPCARVASLDLARAKRRRAQRNNTGGRAA